MTETVYTAVTFAPVQGFIQKSRKLRDLYGSSFILSYLAKAVCEAAREYFGVDKQDLSPERDPIVSPALINLTQGTPNQIIIAGDKAFPEKEAKKAFEKAWRKVTEACRKHIQEKVLPDYKYNWQRHWNAWTNYAWEFFHIAGKPGQTITDVRQKLNQTKYQRSWVGINWVGESSTLSGGDAVAWYGMANANPKQAKQGEIDDNIRDFYSKLSQNLSNSIIDENEQLSIPELIKRLVTLRDIAEELNLNEEELPNIEIPLSFKDINRKKDHLEENRYTGWFQGDGDKIGDYLQSLVDAGTSEETALHNFSAAMMEWGKYLKFNLPNSQSKSDDATKYLVPSDIHEEVKNRYIKPPEQKVFYKEGRIIYAGGDDFLGVLYRNYPESKLTALECLEWFYKFPENWEKHNQKITVSIGFVWAAPGVPQRDVLQHCHEAEKSAKSNGRDRLAIRILFNSGTHIEWVCPWWWLKSKKDQECGSLLTSYRDKEGNTKSNQTTPNWTHFYNDVATLESHHAFDDNHEIALALFEIYFGINNSSILKNPQKWWNNPQGSQGTQHQGIFGEKTPEKEQKINQLINDWVINLAKVGFHLHSTNNEQ